MVRNRMIMIGLLLFMVVIVGSALALQEIKQRHRIAPTNVGPLAFDSRGWASGSATKRNGMARSLVENRTLEGQPKDHVINMLGQPTHERLDGQLEWYLGPRKSGASLMFDYQGYLVTTLDGNGNCATAIISERD